MRIKDYGQVFTPNELVIDILNNADYFGSKIIKKHIIDNSCGDGAFLIEIVRRYIYEYKRKYGTYKGVENDLQKYIHGIEIDEKVYNKCLINLSKLTKTYNIEINFDIINDNALNVKKFNGLMDYVVGNPPYVRVHNLKENYESVKKFDFARHGMTDLYIVFYELGLEMLKQNGTLCYITPNSILSSVAGKNFRNYIYANRSIELIVNLGHYQPFNVTTYTCIIKIIKDKSFSFIEYWKYDPLSKKQEKHSDIEYDNLFIDNKIILSDDNISLKKYLNYDLKKELMADVKNGFATLNDSLFISDDFCDLCDNENIIDVIKASTGKWKKALYPYDKHGKLLKFDSLSNDVKKYFLANKELLVKKNNEDDSNWYGYGRTQAIKDVYVNKISINTCIKNIDSIKLSKVNKGQGVYSGLYIRTKISFDIIYKIIKSNDFIQYISSLNKCKSGGYYTFSSTDLSKYINYKIEEMQNEK